MNFKVAISEMYARIHWKLFANPSGSAEHTSETSNLNDTNCRFYDNNTKRLVRCFNEVHRPEYTYIEGRLVYK